MLTQYLYCTTGAAFLPVLWNCTVIFARDISLNITAGKRREHVKSFNNDSTCKVSCKYHRFYSFVPRKMHHSFVIFKWLRTLSRKVCCIARHLVYYSLFCAIAYLQTDAVLSLSSSPRIHRFTLAQTGTSVCVQTGVSWGKGTTWCLKRLQQVFVPAWVQFGGIPNSSIQS